MEIKSISGGILKSSSNRIENAGTQTNPFGVSFKGNIISADVFESADNKSRISFGARVSNRSKLAMSAIIGSVSSMGQSLRRFARVDSIIAVGKKIRENVSGALNYLNTNNLRIELGKKLAIVKRETKGLLTWGTDEVQSLKRLVVPKLEGMLKEEIAVRGYNG